MKTQSLQSGPRRGELYSAVLAGVFMMSVLLVSCGRHAPRSYGHRGQGWIGVYVQDIDAEMRGYLKLDSRRGVLVNDVVEESPAERAGLRQEDVIVKFDGKSVAQTENLSRAVARLEPGEKAKIEIIRSHRKKKLTVRVQERPRRFAASSRRHHRFYSRGSRRAYLGIRTADLDDDLADYFEIDGNDGILVVAVAKDGPAGRSGMKSGDVILQIENEPVRDSEELLDRLSEVSTDGDIEIELMRKGEKKKLTVELAAEQFDFHDWGDRHDWKHKMRSWQGRMKNWRRDLESELDEHENRIHLDIPLEELGDELEKELRSLDDEIGQQLRELQDELHDVKIEIDIDNSGEVI